jgi:hypothetical protein
MAAVADRHLFDRESGIAAFDTGDVRFISRLYHMLLPKFLPVFSSGILWMVRDVKVDRVPFLLLHRGRSILHSGGAISDVGFRIRHSSIKEGEEARW